MIVFSATMAGGIKALADYVRKTRNEKGLSTTQVQARSGGAIKDATVSKIEGKKQATVTLDKIEALANGLGVPVIDLLEAFYGKSLYKGKDEINLDDLSKEQKELIRTTVKHMVSGMNAEPENKLTKVKNHGYLNDDTKDQANRKAG